MAVIQTMYNTLIITFNFTSASFACVGSYLICRFIARQHFSYFFFFFFFLLNMLLQWKRYADDTNDNLGPDFFFLKKQTNKQTSKTEIYSFHESVILVDIYWGPTHSWNFWRTSTTMVRFHSDEWIWSYI